MEENKYYNKIISHIYSENKHKASFIRSQFNTETDTILLSSDRYNLKSSRSRKFFNINKTSEQSPSKPMKRVIQPKPNENKDEVHKKIFPEKSKRSGIEVKPSHVRFFPKKSGIDNVGNIIQNTEPDNKLNKPKIKVNINSRPSAITIKHNDKKKLLPCEIENIYHENKRNRYYYRNNSNSIIFTDYTNIRPSSVSNTTIPKDNITRLLSYTDGPKFREEKITHKINVRY